MYVLRQVLTPVGHPYSHQTSVAMGARGHFFGLNKTMAASVITVIT